MYIRYILRFSKRIGVFFKEDAFEGRIKKKSRNFGDWESHEALTLDHHFRWGQERLKGTVSRELRLLLYINQKLFSRAIVGYHKILILLKVHFTINKRRSSV